MYEFTFLTPDRGANFVEQLKSLGIKAESRPDPINDAVTNVAIPDDIDEDLLPQIEAWYEDETSRNEAAARALEDENDIVSAGIWVQLEDGGSSLARVDPDIMNRILTVLTPDELGEFVSVIADAVEHPDVTPICHNKSTSSCS